MVNGSPPFLASPATASYINASSSTGGVEQQRLQNILVVRTDHIGDVILTLPITEVLKSNFPAARVAMLVSSYTAGLVEGIADPILYNREGIQKPFFEMLTELRRARFDAAVVAYPRFRIALLLWLAGVSMRIGTGYRWYSFLFNKRMYEHRKTIEKHEAEYNLSLLNVLGCTIPSKPEVHIVISENEKETARSVLRAIGISDDDQLVLLHPGSGGSARDWKPQKFAQLAKELKHLGFSIVITGTKAEEELVHHIVRDAGQNVKPFISNLSLKEFAAFIQSAKLFVANSTGPLHIAAVVGTPVIGFYPPIHVMSPKRWGPLTDRKVIFVPDPAKCPRCKGGRCRGNECMDQIEVHRVVEAATKLIAGQLTMFE
jgi:lipopolysaccharide heptosyltransferase II